MPITKMLNKKKNPIIYTKHDGLSEYSILNTCYTVLYCPKFGVPGSQQPEVKYYLTDIVPRKTPEMSEKCLHAVQTYSTEKN